MKRTGFVVIAGALLALASPASANQIQVGYSGSSFGPYQSGQGGEFTLNDVNPEGWLDLSGYVAGKTSNVGLASITSFQSFCIEKNEFIYPYTASYDATVSDAADNGGVAGGNPDYLSKGTSFLYSEFARGTLANYNYGAGRANSALLLQEAIWWLENELTSYTAGNDFINLVATTFGTAAAGRANAGAGEYGVYALNLTGAGLGAPGGPGQDQLYYKAVPDAGTTFTLFGMALTGVGLVSRRFRRS